MTTPVGRNDPCPCGSGTKYKKCCFLKDDAAVRSPGQRWHHLDERLAREIGQFMSRRFGDAWSEVLDDYPYDLDEEDDEAAIHLPLLTAWMMYERDIEGRRPVDRFLEERGRNLDGVDRAWLEAQRRAWLSVWEVTDVTPGASVTVRDMLTGEERTVTEVRASEILEKHLVVLTRVVDHDGMSLFIGMHPQPLLPVAGARLVVEIRREMDLPKRASPARLKDGDVPTELVAMWVGAVDEQTLPPTPELRNTDDEALVMVKDRYALVGKTARSQIERLLAAQKDMDSQPGRKGTEYVFLRKVGADGRSAKMPTLLGHAVLTARELLVDANSIERADALRARVEKLCGGLVKHKKRSEQDGESMMAVSGERKKARASSPPMAGPEADALILDVKKQHYGDWVDVALPALDGLTPREAAADATYRAKIALLIKDIESREVRAPKGQRFDFSEIRRELRLEK